MSLLIKGINKVAFCIDCPCGHVDNSGVGYDNGKLMCTGQYQIPIYDKGTARNEIKDCPLSEIPTPHGRLIDADVIMDLLEKSVPEKNRGHQFYVFRHMLRNAPTVIEAEE